MPTYRKCAPFCFPHNQCGLVGMSRNNPCDGYFGCDDEEIFQDDKEVLLKSNENEKKQNYLPWVKRQSPPVLSFFKRVASLRKQLKKKKCNGNGNGNGYGYRTLPNLKTKHLDVGYKCFPFDSGFTSLRRNCCCDGYFGCPPN